jgi:hypothetical protein
MYFQIVQAWSKGCGGTQTFPDLWAAHPFLSILGPHGYTRGQFIETLWYRYWQFIRNATESGLLLKWVWFIHYSIIFSNKITCTSGIWHCLCMSNLRIFGSISIFACRVHASPQVFFSETSHTSPLSCILQLLTAVGTVQPNTLTELAFWYEIVGLWFRTPCRYKLWGWDVSDGLYINGVEAFYCTILVTSYPTRPLFLHT